MVRVGNAVSSYTRLESIPDGGWRIEIVVVFAVVDPCRRRVVVSLQQACPTVSPIKTAVSILNEDQYTVEVAEVRQSGSKEFIIHDKSRIDHA